MVVVRAVERRAAGGADLDLVVGVLGEADALDAGLDVVAREAAVLAPGGGRALVPTGIAFALPVGYAGFVQPRSGLALRHGVTVLNSPGTIDADYRGEVQVLLINHGLETFTVERGERIAQRVVARHERVALEPCEALEETARGAGGFGHTGRS